MHEAPITEGYSPFRGHQTWYRVTGNPHAARAPLVVAHGGPGCTHDYVLSYADLAQDDRLVIHYDQLGNGRSTHLPEAPADFWTVDLFLDELDALLSHLGIASRYNLLGQSWGGMLGAEHAVRRPAGLNALVIANSPASMPLWRQGCLQLRDGLPPAHRDALIRHEERAEYTHPDYVEATRVFYERHVCRQLPWPEDVSRTFGWIDKDPTVYHTMNGPTEFQVVGSLRDWQVIDRLHLVEAPTLVLSGKYDEATPLAVAPFAEHIAGAQWVVFEQSSHMPHVEERQSCMRIVGDFLASHD